MVLNRNDTVVVAMSGGVDSSTAAALLVEQGVQVVGLTMRLWDPRRMLPPLVSSGEAVSELEIFPERRCCGLAEAIDARQVATQLGIPFYMVNLTEKFEQAVVQQFVASYLRGQTPNPCVLCNNVMKFEHLLALAEQFGATHLATGHYARSRFNEKSGRYDLLRGVDLSKDQSYFLFGLTQAQLARALFPVGEMKKEEVRSYARAHQLPVAEKAESQEICFVPTGRAGNYAYFIEAYLSQLGSGAEFTPRQAGHPPSGEIVTTDGRLLGSHHGLYHFTVGQRRGLGIATGKPLYVVALDPMHNRVVVGEESELHQHECHVSEVNWIAVGSLTVPTRAEVKIRNKHAPAAATLFPGNNNCVRVVFDQAQRAITPGQAAVFYQGEVVLGGGWIR